MMSLCSYVFTHEISSVRYISMFGIRVEWKDTKRFTWFCVTQYFDSRFLIWYSWFDSSETRVTCSTISTATEYQRKYSFHSRIDTVCNEIRRNNSVEIYKRILSLEFRVFCHDWNYTIMTEPIQKAATIRSLGWTINRVWSIRS